MSLSFPEDIDPKAPLSNEDLVRVLTWYCHDICNKIVDENLKLERELCNDKIKKVIEGFRIIAGTFNNPHAVLTQRLSDLELKVDTLSSYQEHVIYDLRESIEKLEFSPRIISEPNIDFKC